MIIKAKSEGRSVVLKMPKIPAHEDELDLFEQRAYEEWVNTTGEYKLSEFQSSRYSYILDLCKALGDEFGVDVQ